MTGPRDCICPKCDGEGGWPANPDRPSRTLHDYTMGEIYRTNWEECDMCGGDGEIEQEDDSQ